MMGDSVANIKAGQVFGATAIWCAWGCEKIRAQKLQMLLQEC
jgi:hypothetical protein